MMNKRKSNYTIDKSTFQCLIVIISFLVVHCIIFYYSPMAFAQDCTPVNKMVQNGEIICDSIGCIGEADTYKFTGNANGRAFVHMGTDNCGDVDPHIRLFDPDGVMLCESKVISTVECTDDDVAEIIGCELPVNGTYSVKAFDLDGDETGEYGITIQLLSNGKTFPDASTVINFGDTIPTSLSCPGEVDSYAFFALSGDAINARMSTADCGDVDPHIRLFDPNGEMLCEAKVNDTVECIDDDLAEIVSCILPIDGVYVLLASDVDGNESGDYGVNLSCISAVCGTSSPSPIVTPPSIASFNPTSATTGETVVITGENFTGATGVSFGGTPAASFIVDTDTQISAVVGSGSSGNVTVTTPDGTASLSGFVFIPVPEPPVVTSAAPVNLPRTGQVETFHAGDDGAIQAGVVWPDPRFTDNGDGTLTDNLTGLMWLKDGGCLGNVGWEQALINIADFNNNTEMFSCEELTAKFTDWRLPNILELDSLVNAGAPVSDIWLIGQGFKDILSGLGHWSSTNFGSTAWSISSQDKIGGNLVQKSSTLGGSVFVVRGTTSLPSKLRKTGQVTESHSGDDGAIQAGVPWPNPRFTDNGDGTMKDNLTGLMWLKDANCFGGLSWEAGFDTITEFNKDPGNFTCLEYTTNFDDWRMPNKNELKSIINYGVAQTGSWLNTQGFKNVANFYWSSTTVASNINSAWHLILPTAIGQPLPPTPLTTKDTSISIWPVRGGQIIKTPPPPTTPVVPPPSPFPATPVPPPTPEISPVTTPFPGEAGSPTAEFGADPLTGFEPLTVKFADKSTGNPTSWSWEFGDGGISSEQNPTHTYQQDGNFTVRLIASNSRGSDTEEKLNLIAVKDIGVCKAAFNADKTSGFAPLEVKFTDRSTGNPTSWSWEFGDGDISSEQNPTHIYQIPGIFTVRLTISAACGSDIITQTNLINVLQPPEINAEFNANPTAGFAPLDVQFNNLSTGNPAGFAWLFGDGNSSAEKDPLHTYRTPGVYTVTLVASGQGADIETKTNMINILGGVSPTAAFEASPLTGFAPIKVQFNDTSSGNITNWSWDFGDGTVSSLQNPIHEYKNSGFFNVKLTVSGNDGTGVEEKINLINILDGQGPTAAFFAEPLTGNAPLTVHFFDISSGEISNWTWEFGDGDISIEQNPVHTYNTPGNFNVKLTVSGKDGTSSETKTGLISVLGGTRPSAAFIADKMTKGNAGSSGELSVRFMDISSSPTGAILSREWDFGDGATSEEKDPEHSYVGTADDVFAVRLTVQDSNGIDTVTKQAFISLEEDNTTARPSPTPTPIPTPPVTSGPDISSLTVSPEMADRSLGFQTAFVTARDQDGQPLSGINVMASASGLFASVGPSSAITGSDGTAVFRFRFGLLGRDGIIIFTADNLITTIEQR